MWSPDQLYPLANSRFYTEPKNGRHSVIWRQYPWFRGKTPFESPSRKINRKAYNTKFRSINCVVVCAVVHLSTVFSSSIRKLKFGLVSRDAKKIVKTRSWRQSEPKLCHSCQTKTLYRYFSSQNWSYNEVVKNGANFYLVCRSRWSDCCWNKVWSNALSSRQNGWSNFGYSWKLARCLPTNWD